MFAPWNHILLLLIKFCRNVSGNCQALSQNWSAHGLQATKLCTRMHHFDFELKMPHVLVEVCTDSSRPMLSQRQSVPMTIVVQRLQRELLCYLQKCTGNNNLLINHSPMQCPRAIYESLLLNNWANQATWCLHICRFIIFQGYKGPWLWIMHMVMTNNGVQDAQPLTNMTPICLPKWGVSRSDISMEFSGNLWVEDQVPSFIHNDIWTLHLN